jgi:hypothetical protein
MQMAQAAPQIYNLPQLHRQMIDVLGVKNAEKLVPTDDDQTPRDPISENMAFLKGSPTKAFIYQDHDAHIAAHSTFMQDPMILQQMGQNPMAQQMMAAVQAHMAEHLAYLYRKKIEEQLGTELPPPDKELPPEVEVQLSQLVAQASVQLLQQNKAMAQQQQNQEMAKDPLVQMQQAELQIKKQDADTKAKKVEGDLQIKQAELQIKAQQAQGQQGEHPQITADRHQQEMSQQQQRHMAEMQRAQQLHAQGMQQTDQLHGHKMTQAEQNRRITAAQKLQQMMQAQQAAAKPPGGTQ